MFIVIVSGNTYFLQYEVSIRLIRVKEGKIFNIRSNSVVAGKVYEYLRRTCRVASPFLGNAFKSPIKFHACGRFKLTFHLFTVPRRRGGRLRFFIALPRAPRVICETHKRPWCRQWTFYRPTAFFCRAHTHRLPVIKFRATPLVCRGVEFCGFSWYFIRKFRVKSYKLVLILTIYVVM